MKVEEVPQNGKYFEKTYARDICYAVDDKGNYRQVVSVGWEPKNDALSLVWENISEEAESIRQEVLRGEKSPLAFHMKMCLLNVGMLSAYTDIPKRLVKKHLTTAHFRQLDDVALKKYADAMNITVEELKKV
jgi:hypothetical protein